MTNQLDGGGYSFKHRQLTRLGLKNLAVGVFARESKVNNLQEVLLDRFLEFKQKQSTPVAQAWFYSRTSMAIVMVYPLVN